MKLLLVALAILVAMAVCGGLAMFGVAMLLMELGMRWHDNYEYYGQKCPWMVYAAGVVGFVIPALVAVFFAERRSRQG